MATSYSEYSRDEQGKAKQTQEIISVATHSIPAWRPLPHHWRGTYQEAQQLALLIRAGLCDGASDDCGRAYHWPDVRR